VPGIIRNLTGRKFCRSSRRVRCSSSAAIWIKTIPCRASSNAPTPPQKVYAADNATNHFAVIIQKNTGHQVKPESERAAIEWFVKWLKP